MWPRAHSVLRLEPWRRWGCIGSGMLHWCKMLLEVSRIMSRVLKRTYQIKPGSASGKADGEDPVRTES